MNVKVGRHREHVRQLDENMSLQGFQLSTVMNIYLISVSSKSCVVSIHSVPSSNISWNIFNSPYLARFR